MSVTIDDIRDAARLIEGQVARTPMLHSRKLSQITGAEIYVKLENLQYTNSFKERGAYVRLASLSAAEKKKGVIAMSAGNHAQAVAHNAARLGVPATIVMPETTPFVKIERTEALGAKVVLSGETLAECQDAVHALMTEHGHVLIHPYDDDRIIAGQGTVALEMLDDEPGLDALVIPIGGGGLISGNAIAAHGLKPDIEVVGVEAALYPSMACALEGKTPEFGGQTLADGIAVKNVVERTFSIIKEHVSDVILLDEGTIEQAINAFLVEQKTVAEGAGAAGFGAVLAEPERFRGRRVGLILCGGNIDPRILASIIYRQLVRGRRIVSFRVQIPDRPGVLGEIASYIGKQGANILEVSHRRMFLDLPARGAGLDIMVETRDETHARRLVAAIEGLGYTVRMLDAPGGRETEQD